MHTEIANAMNYLAQTLSKFKFVQRLIELDVLLSRAAVAAAHYRMFSLTTAGPAMKANHRELTDEFNAKKFWFMRKRKYEI